MECPLWVKSRHVQCRKACPLYPRKRSMPPWESHSVLRRIFRRPAGMLQRKSQRAISGQTSARISLPMNKPRCPHGAVALSIAQCRESTRCAVAKICSVATTSPQFRARTVERDAALVTRLMRSNASFAPRAYPHRVRSRKACGAPSYSSSGLSLFAFGAGVLGMRLMASSARR